MVTIWIESKSGFVFEYYMDNDKKKYLKDKKTKRI